MGKDWHETFMSVRDMFAGIGVFFVMPLGVGLWAKWDEHQAPERGTVAGARHEAAKQEMWWTGQTLAPMSTPEKFSLELKGGGKDGWRDVSEAEYKACPIGESYPVCAQRSHS